MPTYLFGDGLITRELLLLMFVIGLISFKSLNMVSFFYIIRYSLSFSSNNYLYLSLSLYTSLDSIFF